MKKLWLHLVIKVSYFCQFWQYLENNSGDVWPIYIGRGNSVIGSQSFPISLTLKHYKKLWNYASYLSWFQPYLTHIFSFLGQFSVRRSCFSAKRVWGLLGEKLLQQFTTKPIHLDLLSLHFTEYEKMIAKLLSFGYPSQPRVQSTFAQHVKNSFLLSRVKQLQFTHLLVIKHAKGRFIASQNLK